MLQHVYERANLARYLTSTIIATDDERVYEAARTPDEHLSVNHRRRGKCGRPRSEKQTGRRETRARKRTA